MREMAAGPAGVERPEEILLALLDASPAAVAAKDTDGRYVVVNALWAELNGVRREDVLGRTDAEAFRDGQPLALCAPPEQTGDGERVQTLTIDGQDRLFKARFYALRSADGNAFAYCCRAVEVTDEGRERALRDGANEVLELIATGAPLPRVLETLVVLVEQHASGLLASVLLLDDDGARVRHGAAPHLPEAYSEAIDGEPIGPKAGSCGTAAYRREQVIVTDVLVDPLWEDYRELAVASGLRACWSTPIFASDGRVLGTFAMYYREPRSPTREELRLTEFATHLAGIAIDRERAADSLRRSEQQLRQSQKMEAVGRLAGGIAHDFNNLLTAIGGYTELLLDKLPPEQRDDAEQIRHAADRAAALTKQLLAFTRRQVVQRESLDLNDVVRDMDRLLRRLIGAGVEVVSVLAPEPVQVEADRSQLEQVIVNLVLNARDAMPGGGKLVIATSHEGDWVELRVEDTGVGIEESVRPHVFEPFFTTKEPGRGTGLGLATVLGIVEQQGGRIELETAVGEGTTFRLRLPTAAFVPPAAAPPTAEPRAPNGSGTLLVVEDEDIIRALVVRTLRGAGYEVLEARYASEALERWEERREDVALLLTDIVMPGMSGVELARRLGEERPELPILLMSGFADPDAGGPVPAPRSAGFLEKPFTPSELLRCVRERLG
jgi:PAS domain S-box-containing protein